MYKNLGQWKQFSEKQPPTIYFFRGYVSTIRVYLYISTILQQFNSCVILPPRTFFFFFTRHTFFFHPNKPHIAFTITTMKRKCISISQKLSILRILDTRCGENGEPLRKVAKELGVDASQLRRWKRQRTKMEELLQKTPQSNVNTGVKTLCPGRKSCLHGIEEELLQFIREQREQGLAVSVRMVLTKACQLLLEFRHKTPRAKDQAIRRFIASHGIVHRVHTHQSQECHLSKALKAKDWIEQIRPRLTGCNRDPRFIINMDQTPIFFSMLPRTTLEVSGARSVDIRTSTNTTMRVTVAVTVTANGDMLPPLIVFKGKTGGRIEREFSNFDAGGIYCCQEKAWMDESIMLKWVETVLRPYIGSIPAGIEPILFLDSYRCHMMTSVVNVIQDMGVQVEHIPGGCTGLCGPVDVGIGLPFKARVRNVWEDWMVEQGIPLKFVPPSRERVASWVVKTLQQLPLDIVRNGWRHQPYSYFQDEDLADGNLTLL